MKGHIDSAPGGVMVMHVSFSRRNLNALLALLDERNGEASIIRSLGEGMILAVYAEEDADHYQGREPGVMPEDIEHKIQSRS